jgi:hypothetical protein
MKTQTDAQRALHRAWPTIVRECRQVLGSEQHYQAVVYHCLRTAGRTPVKQLGMNVKMWIERPRAKFFRLLDVRKHEDYRGGFEPIPDVILFAPAIQGDWRRRQCEETLKQMIGAIEIKASERDQNRLQKGEIIRDIEKLAAHREEKKHRHHRGFYAAMMVIDTAPDEKERVTAAGLEKIMFAASAADVEFFYLSKRRAIPSLRR